MKPSNYTPQSVVWPRPICPRAERLVPWKPLPMNLSTCLETPITKDFVVYRHKTSKGRVLENAGTRTYKRPSGPGRWNNRPGVDWVAADKPPPIARERKASSLGCSPHKLSTYL